MIPTTKARTPPPAGIAGLAVTSRLMETVHLVTTDNHSQLVVAGEGWGQTAASAGNI